MLHFTPCPPAMHPAVRRVSSARPSRDFDKAKLVPLAEAVDKLREKAERGGHFFDM